jgi:RsiW-degrading membrane proteinase PrsW (M82 family)
MTAGTPPLLRGRLAPHLRWVTVLLVGSALYAAVLAALLGTQDIIYVPSLLLIGATVVPVTFTTFIGGLPGRGTPTVAQIAAAAALGGVIATVVAGTLEYETIRTLGSLPTVAIGLIEESAKLAVPAGILAWRRPRPRPMEGLVLGVAVGSGFAALETMGYAFATLLHSGGRLEPVTQLLAIRSVAEPGGHAAWTGLACAALFAVRGARRRWLGWLRFCLVFAGAMALHATWDSVTANGGYLAVGGGSFALLMAATWLLHRDQTARDNNTAQHHKTAQHETTGPDSAPAAGTPRPVVGAVRG